MMRVRSLSVQGFRSFKADSLLPFPKGWGFYFLRGENRVQPRLGGNGCGKSSLWDALSWVFFGKTARGLRGPDVANWEESDLTSVQVEFTAPDGSDYLLIRTHSPNSLALTKSGSEPRTVSQLEVESLVGLDHDGFLYQVLMGQFGRFFFDIGPAEKLNLFSKALNLDYWLIKAKEAKEYGEAAASRVTGMERELAELEGRAAVLRENKRELREASEEWDRQQAQHVREVQRDRAKASDALVALNRDRRLARRKRKGLESERSKLLARRDRREAQRVKLRDAVKDLQRDLRSSDDDLARAKKQLAEIKELGGGECPTCEQRIKDRHVCNVRERYKLLFQVNRTEAEWIEQRLGRAEKDLERASSKLARTEERLRSVEGELREAERQEDAAKADMRRTEEAIIRLKGQARENEERANPDRERYRKVRRALRKATMGRGKLISRIEKAKAKAAKGEYWAKAFKKLRLSIIEEALVELEVATNNSLEELGLEGWIVKYDVEKENKSGGVTKGFSVFVQSPESEKPVRWENWSGGETQRLRVAGATALADLTSSRRGIRWNLEVWDEPTAFMSEEGIQDLLSFFESRSRRDRKQLWLVDHRALNFGGFDGQFTVVKEASGSKVMG